MTHIMSPQMVAGAAIAGRLVDIRQPIPSPAEVAL
jgi:homoaconitase/3-isopropylmalate dehydratase large subunit